MIALVNTVRFRCVLKTQIAATVAAGVVGSIKKRAAGEEDATICVNVAMSKTALDVTVCALPTDVAYNRCAACWVLLSLAVPLSPRSLCPHGCFCVSKEHEQGRSHRRLAVRVVLSSDKRQDWCAQAGMCVLIPIDVCTPKYER